MIDSKRFSLIYKSNSLFKERYKILLCGTIKDINKYQNDVLNELSSILDCDIYVRLDENKIIKDEIKDFHLYIYLISKESLLCVNNERYIYQLPRYCVNYITICMDEFSFQRVNIEQSNNILVRHDLYSKLTYLKLLKITLENNFISNDLLKDMNDVTNAHLSFSENLAMWFGINHKRDVKQAYLNFYQGEDISSDMMSCLLEYSNFDESKEIYLTYDINHDLNVARYLKQRFEKDKSFANFRAILSFLNIKFKKFGSKFTRTYIHDDEIYDFIKLYLEDFDLYREYCDDTLAMFIDIILAKVRGSIFEENEVDVVKIIKSASKVVDYTRNMPYWNERILIEFGLVLIEHNDDIDDLDKLIANTIEQINLLDDEYLSDYYFANLYDLLSKPLLKGNKSSKLLKYLDNAIHYYEELFNKKPSFRNCVLLMMMYENAIYKTIESGYIDYHTPLYEKYSLLILNNYHSSDDYELIRNALDFNDELLDLEDEIEINIKFKTYQKLRKGLLNLINFDDIEKHPKLLKETIRLYRLMIYDGYLNTVGQSFLQEYNEKYHELLNIGASICLFDGDDIKDIEDFSQVINEICLYDDSNYQTKYIENNLRKIFTNIAKYSYSIDIYKKACSHTYAYMNACMDDEKAVNQCLDDIEYLGKEMNKLDLENKFGDEWLAKAMFLRCTYKRTPPYDVDILLKAKELLTNLRDRAYEGYLNVVIQDIDDAINKSGN